MSSSLPSPRSSSAASSNHNTVVVKAGGTTYVYRSVGPQNRECLVPEDQPDNSEFTFVRRVDPSSGREFFVNVLTRNRVWVLPDVSALAPMRSLPNTIERSGTVFQLSLSSNGEKVYAPQDLPIPLQPGHCWLPRPDRIHQKYFFVNAATKEKMMFLPPTSDLMDRIRYMYEHYAIAEPTLIPENWRASSEPHAEGGSGASPYEETLTQWAGREVQVLAQLVLKYGAEPPRPSSVQEVTEAYVREGVSQEDVTALLQVMEDSSPKEQLDALRDAFGAPPRTLRHRILSMYHHYAPDKLHQVDEVTNQFGQKHLPELLDNLIAKWGAEPKDNSSAMTSPRSAALANSKIEQRVAAMLAAYDSANLHKAQEYLVLFRGNEQELLENLVRRFGPEPAGAMGASSKSSVGSLTPRSHSTQSVQLKSPEGELDAENAAAAGDNPHRDRLVAFYRRYNPGKLAGVGETLRKYAGQEAFLMDQLVRKYGPEPSSPLLGAASARHSSPGTSPMHSGSPQPIASFEASASDPPVNIVPTRERIEAMYTVYAADQLGGLDNTLQLYNGDEKAMLDALVGAYGPEPSQEQLEHARRAAEQTAGKTRKRGQSLVDQTRTKVSALLREHDPDAMTTIDRLLSQYSGREEELVKELTARYEEGGEASATSVAFQQYADPQDPVALEQIRQQIAEKARAENEAFLKRLDATDGIVEESLANQAPSDAVHGRTSPMPTSTSTIIEEPTPRREATRQLVSVTPAVLPSDVGVGQLYAVERQLHEALDATERVLRRNETLHEENMRLSNAQRVLQQQCDAELRVVRNQLDEVQATASRMRHEFALEKIQLKMQEEGAVLRLKQETQEERAKYVSSHLETLSEKKQLEQLLMETKSALANSDSQCRTLEVRIKRRDKELEDAKAEVKFLTIQLDKSNCEDTWTQTDQLLQWSPSGQRSDKRLSLQKSDLATSPRSGGEGAPTSAGASRDDTNDIGQLRSLCEELERELAVVKAKHREAMEECENATKFIHVLKNKKRKLEERVAHLELRELALPDAPPSHTEVECRRLEAEVSALQDQLAGADAQTRKSKREIAELRSLLSLHMAGSTPRSIKKRVC